MASENPYDQFDNLNPYDRFDAVATPQNETIDRLAQKKPKPVDANRIGAVFGTHAANSVAGLPGTLGSAQELLATTGERFAPPEDKKIGAGWGLTSDPDLASNPALRDYPVRQYPTAQDVQGVLQELPIPGTKNVGVIPRPIAPETTGEKIAAALGDYAPAAIGAPGALSGAVRVGGSAAGGKIGAALAGDLSKTLKASPEDQQLAQMWGEVLGGGGGFIAGRKLGQNVEGADYAFRRGASNTISGVVDSVLGKKPEGPITTETYLAPVQGVGAAKTPRIGREPAPPKSPPPAPINRSLAERGDTTPEAFDTWYERLKKRGIEPLEGEAYGRPGIDRWSAINRLPGKSGPIAEEAILGSIDNPQASGAKYQLQSQSLSALDKLTGGEQALTSKIRAAEETYKPILTDQAVTPQLETKAMQILSKVDRDSLSTIADEATKTANSFGYAKMNKAQQLHFLKRALYGLSQKLQENPQTSIRGAQYGRVFNDLRNLLHSEEGIAGLKAADNAYEALAKQKSLDDSLRGSIMRGKEGKNPGYVGMSLAEQKALRDAFGPAADDFIIGQRITDRRASNLGAVLPGSNSTTFKNAAHAADNALEHAQSFAEKPIRKTIGTTLDGMFGRVAEKSRDAQGAQFAKPMTLERAREFRKQLEQIEAERRAAALAQALAASQGAKPNPNQQAQ